LRAAASARRALALARELGYPLGQARAMDGLIIGADDLTAVRAAVVASGRLPAR